MNCIKMQNVTCDGQRSSINSPAPPFYHRLHHIKEKAGSVPDPNLKANKGAHWGLFLRVRHVKLSNYASVAKWSKLETDHLGLHVFQNDQKARVISLE